MAVLGRTHCKDGPMLTFLILVEGIIWILIIVEGNMWILQFLLSIYGNDTYLILLIISDIVDRGHDDHL